MKSGSLFSGYGGLDMAVAQVFGAEPAWFSEIEDAPSKILAHHWPDVPNLGDITKIDWDAVDPVDILSGGFPCQDVSAAGKRAGMHPDTRSGLWNHMAYAISKLRPRYVVAENVRGLLSAEAHSDVEPCPWCLGDGASEPALRALGAVLGDLADLGYDAHWCGLRAADVGAPHGRYRIFVFAENANLSIGGQRWVAAPRQAEGGRSWPDRRPGRVGRVATADASHDGCERRSECDREPLGIFAGACGCHADRRAEFAADAEGERHGHAWSESIGGVPTATLAGAPTDTSGDGRDEGWTESAGQLRGSDAAERRTSAVAWGQYGPAVERWERVLRRVAPAPTEPNTKGAQRLNPAFVEWMMGLPAGHVTAVPGVNRNAQLKALGNGVVPQQAIAALRHMYAVAERREVA
jgi:DNA (cytosine-5)-methyltransferase 1